MCWDPITGEDCCGGEGYLPDEARVRYFNQENLDKLKYMSEIPEYNLVENILSEFIKPKEKKFNYNLYEKSLLGYYISLFLVTDSNRSIYG